MDEFRLNIVKTWFNRAKENISGPRDDLNKLFFADGLIYISIAYEALLFGLFNKKHVASNRRDLSKKYSNLLSEHLSDNLKEAIEMLYEESNRKHIEDMSGQGKPVWLKSKDDIDNLLEVAYRVRSNLFHGGKDTSDPRNFKLIKYSFIALYGLVEIVLQKENCL